jgi:hypothetical protein
MIEHDDRRCAGHLMRSGVVSGTVRGLSSKGDRDLPPRFRTIQVYPKDVGMLPRQPKRAVSCASGFRRGAYALRHKAPIHRAARRRGGGVAARGGRNIRRCRWSGFFVVHRLPMQATSLLASARAWR